MSIHLREHRNRASATGAADARTRSTSSGGSFEFEQFRFHAQFLFGADFEIPLLEYGL